MSKTVRRKNATHEYAWVLRDWEWIGYWHLYAVPLLIDPRSTEGFEQFSLSMTKSNLY